jgi:plastocyanin
VRVPLPLTLGAAAALIALAACGGSSSTPQATAPAGATATATAGGGGAGGSDPANVSCNDGGTGSDVSIVDFNFAPTTIAADADATVHWTNNGSATHTVTFDNGKDCGSLAAGDSLTVKFNAPGTYAYHCSIHSSMKGTVTVNG